MDTSRRMITIQKIESAALICGILSLFGCTHASSSQKNKKTILQPLTQETISFERQLDIFNKLGFDLNPGVDTSDINRWGGHKIFEEQPFTLLYTTLGQ